MTLKFTTRGFSDFFPQWWDSNPQSFGHYRRRINLDGTGGTADINGGPHRLFGGNLVLTGSFLDLRSVSGNPPTETLDLTALPSAQSGNLFLPGAKPSSDMTGMKVFSIAVALRTRNNIDGIRVSPATSNGYNFAGSDRQMVCMGTSGCGIQQPIPNAPVVSASEKNIEIGRRGAGSGSFSYTIGIIFCEDLNAWE